MIDQRFFRRVLERITTRLPARAIAPTRETSAFHGLDNFQLAAVGIGEYNLRTLMGLDLEFLDGGVNDPILVFKEDVLVSGLLGPIGAGSKVVARLAFLAGGKGVDCLGAALIRVDGDLPALHRRLCVRLFVNPDQALLLVVPGIHCGLSRRNHHIVETQLCHPVVILGGLFLHRIPPQREVIGTGEAIFIRGVGSDRFAVCIANHKCPATQMAAGVGGLVEFNTAIAGIDEGKLRNLARCHGDGFYLGIDVPIGIFRGVSRA